MNKKMVIRRIVSICLIFIFLFQSMANAADFMMITTTQKSSSNQFPEKIAYNENNMEGILGKDGEPVATVISGSYIPGEAKTINMHSVQTGASIPPSTWYYNSGGYSGSLTRVNYVNNPVEEDHGYDTMVYDPKTFTDVMHENIVTDVYSASGTLLYSTYSWDNSNNHPTLNYDDGEYAGVLQRSGTVMLVEPVWTDNPDGTRTKVTVMAGLFSGTINERKVHIENIIVVDKYTGYYSGTVYTAAVDTRVWEYTQSYRGAAYSKEIFELNYGEPVNSLCVADPVNIISGNFYSTESDLIIPDIGISLEVTRHYNSTDKRTGLLGTGWRFSYEASLTEDTGAGTVIVIYPDGHTVRFVNHEGEYIAPETVFDVLSKNADNSYTLKLQNKLIYTFSPQGKLTAITDKNNNEVSLAYGEDNNLKEVTGEGGKKLRFQIESGKIKTITDDIGRTIVYTYNTNNELVQVKKTNGGMMLYQYDAYGLKSATDANNIKYVENVYDSFGRVVLQYDENRNESHFYYDDANMINTFVNNGPESAIRYKYNEKMFITQIEYSDSTFEEYTYDEWGNRNKIKDRNGNTTSFVYDQRGNLLTKTSPTPFNYQISYTYDSKDNLLTANSSGGASTINRYDENDNLVQVTQRIDDTRNSNLSMSYNSHGQLISKTDAQNKTTTYSYSGKANADAITDSEGNTISFTYDEVNRCSSITDSYGTSHYYFNQVDQVEKIVDPLGNTTRIKYDLMGNKIKLINPNEYNTVTDDGVGYTFVYNGKNKLIKVIDPEGNISSSQYDALGRLVKQVNPNYYDEQNDDGIGVSYIYDFNGRVTHTVNPSGQMTRTVYDPAGNPIKQINANYYDETLDEGPGITYSYNSLNLIEEIKDPEGNVINRYLYDADGRLIKEMDASGYLSGSNDTARYGSLYKYNAAGWLIEKRIPKVMQSSTALYGITQYAYDMAGNLIEEKISQDYVTETGLPQSWSKINYEYNDNYQVTKITDSTGACIEYAYDRNGRKTLEKVKINNTKTSIQGYIYDSAGRLTKTWKEADSADLINGSTGASVYEIQYSYDKNGNISNITDPLGYETTLTYDKAGRLIKKIQEVDEDELTSGEISTASIVSSKDYCYNGQEISFTIEVTPANTMRELSLELEYDTRLFQLASTSSLKGGVLVDGGNSGVIRINTSNITLSGKTSLAVIKLKAKDGVAGKGYLLFRNQSAYKNNLGEMNTLTQLKGALVNVGGPDLNTDGQIATDDFTLLAQHFGLTDSDEDFQSLYDINEDGIIDNSDLDYLSSLLFAETEQESIETGKVTDTLTNTNYNVKSRKAQRITEYGYDKAGNVIKEKDTYGRQTTYTYDELNRIVSITDRDGSTQKRGYDEAGNIAFEVLPENVSDNSGSELKQQYVYNSMNRLDSITDEFNQVILKNIYDTNGRLVKSIDAAGYASAGDDTERYGYLYTYDIGGRLVAETAPEAALQGKQSAVYEYNALDAVIKMTDGEGNATLYQRDDWGKALSVTSADGGVTTYTYDFIGNLSSVKDARSNTVTYSYNSLNKLSKIVDQTGKASYYYYDSAERLAKTVDRKNQVLEYSYNSENKLLAVGLSGQTSALRFVYGKDGRLLASANTAVVDTYEYTAEGYLKGKLRNGTALLNYTYDRNHNVKEIDGISSGKTQYAYDSKGRLARVSADGSLLAEYQYNNDDTVKNTILANGVVSQYSYNRSKNITGIQTKNAGGEVLLSASYTYDNNAYQLTSTENGGTTRYSYDEMNRLASVIYPNDITEGYTYDKNGNRLTKTSGDVTESYGYDSANRLISFVKNNSSITYSYDANGNRTKTVSEEGTTVYVYDLLNRLTETGLPDGGYQVNTYDSSGFRISVDENGTQTNFVDNNGYILAEYDSQGSLQNRYYRGHELIAMQSGQTENPQMYYYVNNYHSDVKSLADGSGSIVNTYNYDAFGNVAGRTGTVDNPFLYAGEQYDEITEQYYLRFRYYDPGMGRFFAEDTYLGDVNSPQSLNLYAYVQNNPINYVDPTGHVMSYATQCTDGGGGRSKTTNWAAESVNEVLIDEKTYNQIIQSALSEAFSVLNEFQNGKYFMLTLSKWGHTSIYEQSEYYNRYNTLQNAKKSFEVISGTSEVSGYLVDYFLNYMEYAQQAGPFGAVGLALAKTVFEDGEPYQPELGVMEFSEFIGNIYNEGLKDSYSSYWKQIVLEEQVKFIYTSTTMYQFLVNDKKGREMFMSKIQAKIDVGLKSKFDDKNKDELYNNAYMGVLKGVYEMNKDYENTYRDLMTIYSNIEAKIR